MVKIMSMKIGRALLMALALMGLCSVQVAHAGDQAVAPDPAVAAPSPLSGTPPLPAAATLPVLETDQSYTLGAGDMVRMIVFNVPSISGEFIVSDTGILSLPLVGDIPSAGKTVGAVRDAITRELANGYLRDPRISLEVLNYRPFYILGEVQKPGEYPYSSKLTVMQAIAKASGFTYSAARGKVFIKSANEPGERRLKLTPDLMVRPGDTIRVGQRHF
jgi:protein involved in polysaccharide export with SLBB domain